MAVYVGKTVCSGALYHNPTPAARLYEISSSNLKNCVWWKQRYSKQFPEPQLACNDVHRQRQGFIQHQLLFTARRAAVEGTSIDAKCSAELNITIDKIFLMA